MGLPAGCGDAMSSPLVALTCQTFAGSIPVWPATVVVTVTVTLLPVEHNGGYMKLADIGNMTTFRSSGKVRKVGNWSFYDNDNNERVVFHYGTMMGLIVRGADGWEFQPVSTGWGSVSDQGGMNKIIRRFGWYYSRKGGEATYHKVLAA